MKDGTTIFVAEADDRLFGLIEHSLQKGAAPKIIRFSDSETLYEHINNACRSGRNREARGAVIIDEDALEKDRHYLPGELTAEPHPVRMPLVVLVDSDRQSVINHYQAAGASICIVKPQDDTVLEDSMCRLAKFLSVVQTPAI